MTTDPDPGRSGRSTDQGEQAERLEELIEALTALGNYLSVAHHMLAEGKSSEQQEILRNALEKAVQHHERGLSALRHFSEY